jgi:HK97 family phage major capsid protein
MKIDELKNMIKDTVKGEINEAVKPLEETQRKYNEVFESKKSERKAEKVDNSVVFTRVAKLLALSKNDPEKALRFAKGERSNTGMYPNDLKLHETLKALSSTTPADGGFLIDQEMSTEVIELLLSDSIINRTGAKRVPMPKGNISIPKLTGGATAYYQGENADATESQQEFGNETMSGKKLTVLVPVSNDLIRQANPMADSIIRDDITRQAGLKFDYTAMYGAGTEFTPLGIKTKIKRDYTANYSATTAVWSADDPAIMRGALKFLNVPMKSPGWLMNSKTEQEFYNLKTTTNQYIYREEMNGGKILNIPYFVSNQIDTANSTTGTTYYDMFLGDFSEFMIGDELSMEVMSSQEASYTTGGSLVSAFQRDQTVIKLTMKHDFGYRHDESFLIYNRKHSS